MAAAYIGFFIVYLNLWLPEYLVAICVNLQTRNIL